MEKLEFGETAVLENGKEFVCFASLEENGVDYVYLVSNFKPLEVRFAKQTINNGELHLEIIQDQLQKQHLYELFKEKMGKIK
jgi:hypothetical protein